MAETTGLSDLRSELSIVAARTANLIESATETTVPIPGSTWTVREAAVHLATIGCCYAGMIHGEPNQYPSLAREECARLNDQRNADIPESDPHILADLVREGTERLTAATATSDDHRQVVFHGGMVVTVPQLLGCALAEHLLHGFDMATAVRRPWPITARQATLGLRGHCPSYGLWLNPARAAAHTAGYGIELAPGERFTMRFLHGQYRLEPAGSGSVDCTITADPVAFLLVGSGRMSQWAAMALGCLQVGGDRPELALGFTDLFLFP